MQTLLGALFHSVSVPPPPSPSFYVLTSVFLNALCSAVIGEMDEEHDSQVDLTKIKAPPLKPVTH